MSNLSMEAIRAALLAKQTKNTGNSETKSTGDNALFPFWETPMGEKSVVRFLPDGDPNNPLFWRERMVIKLPFNGVEGGQYPSTKLVEVQVPCIQMFGRQCPITTDIAPLWDTDQRSVAQTYYRKVSYLYQGLVVNASFEEKDKPENPIRRFTLTPQVQKIIDASLLDADMPLPVDYVNGLDFTFNKTPNGQYASWSTSNWARRERALTESELLAIQENGLFNLGDYLGREPDEDEMAIIMEMYRDSRAGLPFDAEKYGEHGFRAFPAKKFNDTPAAPATQTTGYVAPAAQSNGYQQATQEVRQEVRQETPTEQSSGAKPAQDINALLASIRNGQTN